MSDFQSLESGPLIKIIHEKQPEIFDKYKHLPPSACLLDLAALATFVGNHLTLADIERGMEEEGIVKNEDSEREYATKRIGELKNIALSVMEFLHHGDSKNERWVPPGDVCQVILQLCVAVSGSLVGHFKGDKETSDPMAAPRVGNLFGDIFKEIPRNESRGDSVDDILAKVRQAAESKKTIH